MKRFIIILCFFFPISKSMSFEELTEPNKNIYKDSEMNSNYEKLHEYSKKIHTLSSIEALLSWDQETYMPSQAIAHRAEQISLISSIIHSYQTSDESFSLLNNCIDIETGEIKETDLSLQQKAALREWRRDYLIAKKLPESFVSNFAKATSEASQVWQLARKNDDFALFQPHLEKIVQLCKEKAAYLGYEDHPYDALIDLYEPGMTTKKLTKIFSELKVKLCELLSQIQEKKPIDTSFLYTPCDHSEQLRLGNMILNMMTFDKSASRLDESTHPFTITIHPKDVRLTTRILPNAFMSNILTTIHEGGHGLYELGQPAEQYGSPLAESISLGIHESQSRFWETIIGKNYYFWTFFYPKVQHSFPKAFANISLQNFYKAINSVKPSFIRVESDEVTYCLHIILRFEIEKALLENKLRVDQIPEEWNKKMRELLHIAPKNNREGCLQDIHWAAGIFGYFPTYALGNLYAAQFFNTFKQQNPNWEEELEKGNLEFIRKWLYENIHRHGKFYRANDLIKKVTNRPLDENDYINYLKEKYLNVYS